MGRGPKQICVHPLGDFLVVRLQGVLTAVERSDIPTSGRDYSCRRRLSWHQPLGPPSDTISRERSLAWETVIAAFGMISPVGPPVLERPERAFCASLLPTVMFHTQTSRNAHRLS